MKITYFCHQILIMQQLVNVPSVYNYSVMFCKVQIDTNYNNIILKVVVHARLGTMFSVVGEITLIYKYIMLESKGACSKGILTNGH